MLRHIFFAGIDRSVAKAVAAHQPAAIAVFHGLASGPAVRARDRYKMTAPIVTVVTDLVSTHLGWRDPSADLIVVPSAQVARACELDGLDRNRYLHVGIPVAAEFTGPAATGRLRRELRRSLGLPDGRFLVVLTGGAEGAGGLYRRAATLLREIDDIQVAVLCGRNWILRRRLGWLERWSGGRLTAHGFVSNMADWMRCADVVVGKAGPGTIAEAACCSAPLVLTNHVPGNEDGNAELVVAEGAGLHAPRPHDVATEVARLKAGPARLADMRLAAAERSRPQAAAEIATVLAHLTGVLQREEIGAQ